MESKKIELRECPFCGAPVRLEQGKEHYGSFDCGWAFTHTACEPNECVVRRAIIFVNTREATEWASAWNRRACDGR
jgi:hypothetical protein